MKFSRRDFLKVSALLSGPGILKPLESMNNFLSFHEKPGSSGILFDQTEIPKIKQRLELPIFQSFWHEMLNIDLKPDREFLETGVELNNQLRHLPRVDKILQREAFVYVMTRDQTRAEIAKLALKKILQFEKWDYFLEAGKDVIGIQRAPYTTQSLILAYDWINDLLTDSEKKEILTQLPAKGCEPCYRSLYGMLHPERVIGWSFDPESSFQGPWDLSNWPKILARTNLRAIPLSGLGMGAIFLNGIDPRVDRWMDLVKKSFDEFTNEFQKDGSYPEGVGYCRYASTELILLLEVLQRYNKKNWSRRINWPGVTDFLMITRMPSKNHPDGHVNFGDAAERVPSSIGFWIAKEFNDAISQYAAKHTSTFHNVFSVIWYDPEFKEEKPKDAWFYRHYDIGWVVVSTGFQPDDFVLALRSGGPNNHEHADRNSLLLKCFGENLLVDHWHAAYDYRHPAWVLRTSPAHNTVLVDGKGHQYLDGREGTNSSLAEAKVVNEKVTDKYVIVSSDATQAYQLVNSNVGSVTRTFLVIPELKFFVVIDSLETRMRQANFTARWFVDNADDQGEIEMIGKRFVFRRPGAKLVGCCGGCHGVNLTTNLFSIPGEYGRFPYLDVSSRKSGKKVHLISMFAVIKNHQAMPILNIIEEEKNWLATAKIAEREVRLFISTKNDLPELSIEKL